MNTGNVYSFDLFAAQFFVKLHEQKAWNSVDFKLMLDFSPYTYNLQQHNAHKCFN